MKYVKEILIVVLVGLICWLVYQDFVPGTSFEVVYDFCESQAKITTLSPGDRLFDIEKGEIDCWQKMAKSPVYFDARVPQHFDKAILQVIYKNQADQEFKFGPQVRKEEWAWFLKDVEVTGQENGWSVGRQEFDLSGVYQGSSVMRWLISSTALEESGQLIEISEIKIRFEKEALSFSNFYQQFKSWARKIRR